VLNYNGQLTGQTGLHYRWEGELFVRNEKQLTIKPGPLKRIANERDFLFDTLLESSQLADDVLAADLKAIGNRDVYDDAYFATFFTLSRPILEQRLNDAITAVASMITSAWEQAGKPTLSATPKPRAPQRRRTSQAGAPAAP